MNGFLFITDFSTRTILLAVAGLVLASAVAQLYSYFKSIGNKLDKATYEKDQEKLKEWWEGELNDIKSYVARVDQQTNQNLSDRIVHLETSMNAGFDGLRTQIFEMLRDMMRDKSK